MHPLPDPDLDLLDQEAIKWLELSEDTMATLLGEMETEIDEVRSAFGAG